MDGESLQADEETRSLRACRHAGVPLDHGGDHHGSPSRHKHRTTAPLRARRGPWQSSFSPRWFSCCAMVWPPAQIDSVCAIPVDVCLLVSRGACPFSALPHLSPHMPLDNFARSEHCSCRMEPRRVLRGKMRRQRWHWLVYVLVACVNFMSGSPHLNLSHSMFYTYRRRRLLLLWRLLQRCNFCLPRFELKSSYSDFFLPDLSNTCFLLASFTTS
jgi:hypothetical protein